MMNSKKVTLAVVLATTLAVAYGYGGGAPVEACGDMVPQHHVAPQSTPFPYRISVSKSNIRSGEKVLVTISGKEFKGFFVQGRVGDVPVGTFEPAPGVKLVDCGGSRGSGASHSDPNPKQQIALTWVAPPGLSETVQFRVTVAQDGGTFWVGQKSTPLTISA
ncbi:UNVERIFIED_CONTAM: hypothetical protein PYX00_006514 [Menopon gallinae]|uniref:Reelin domain-containing protein n=1 Tax=Menopon gallinae TaxID=328185 RepID=A0AAW2HVM2_9NEOP